MLGMSYTIVARGWERIRNKRKGSIDGITYHVETSPGVTHPHVKVYFRWIDHLGRRYHQALCKPEEADGTMMVRADR